MKKLKVRIKRALAHFCREELMEYVGYKHTYGPQVFPVNAVKHLTSGEFEIVQMEYAVPLANPHPFGDPKQNYEYFLQDAKKEFSQFIMQHIEIDTRDLMTHEHFNRRSVHLRLVVKRKDR